MKVKYPSNSIEVELFVPPELVRQLNTKELEIFNDEKLMSAVLMEDLKCLNANKKDGLYYDEPINLKVNKIKVIVSGVGHNEINSYDYEQKENEIICSSNYPEGFVIFKGYEWFKKRIMFSFFYKFDR